LQDGCFSAEDNYYLISLKRFSYFTGQEGYGRRRYKAEFIRYLIYAQASCDEATSQAISIIELYPAISEFTEIHKDLDILGKKINSFISFVETDWKT
jgi:hypothetical protein